MAWAIEVTDTFAGDANYSWVRRYTIESRQNDTQRGVMRRAKLAAGYTGVKGRTDWYGDEGAFYPRGACIVIFVNWRDDE